MTEIVRGPDLSSYQGSAIDFGAVLAAGYPFVILKASEGTQQDPVFATTFPAAKRAGLLVGAYCFMHPTIDAGAQADTLVGLAKGADFVMLDIEVGGGNLVPFALAAITEIRRLCNLPIVDYSGEWFGSVTGLWTAPLAPIIRDVAKYGSSPPAEWRLGDFWQYTDAATIPGIPGQVDANAFNGSPTQLLTWLGHTPAPSQSAQGDPMWMNRGAPAMYDPKNGKGYQLDGWGGVHPLGGAPAMTISGYWKNVNIARHLAVSPDGTIGLVVDGFGGLHPVAQQGHPMPAAPSPGFYWLGWDIIVAVVVSDWSNPQRLVGNTIDAWGGVHPFGGAAPLTGMEYFPNNVVV